VINALIAAEDYVSGRLQAWISGDIYGCVIKKSEKKQGASTITQSGEKLFRARAPIIRLYESPKKN